MLQEVYYLPALFMGRGVVDGLAYKISFNQPLFIILKLMTKSLTLFKT